MGILISQSSFNLMVIFRMLLVAVSLVALSISYAKAEEEGPISREVKIKVAVMHKFTKFITWPDSDFASENSEFSVCTFGAGPVASAVESMLAGKEVERRKIVVNKVSEDSNDVVCHMLYVSAETKIDVATILSKVTNQSVLTIGDRTEFIEQGGMIRLYARKNRLRFEINHEKTTDVNIKISSKLLSIAKLTSSSNK